MLINVLPKFLEEARGVMARGNESLTGITPEGRYIEWIGPAQETIGRLVAAGWTTDGGWLWKPAPEKEKKVAKRKKVKEAISNFYKEIRTPEEKWDEQYGSMTDEDVQAALAEGEAIAAEEKRATELAESLSSDNETAALINMERDCLVEELATSGKSTVFLARLFALKRSEIEFFGAVTSATQCLIDAAGNGPEPEGGNGKANVRTEATNEKEKEMTIQEQLGVVSVLVADGKLEQAESAIAALVGVVKEPADKQRLAAFYTQVQSRKFAALLGQQVPEKPKPKPVEIKVQEPIGPWWDVLVESWEKRMFVTVEYTNAKGQMGAKTLLPVAPITEYILAWDVAFGEIRRYRVDRVSFAVLRKDKAAPAREKSNGMRLVPSTTHSQRSGKPFITESKATAEKYVSTGNWIVV